MIETLPEKRVVADIRLSADVAASFSAVLPELKGRSQIVWGEHCSECAYPSCYSHCAFYTPRSDFNCRRFQAGFEAVADAPGLHRVRFRKWGKLEGRGPAAVWPAKAAEGRDHRNATASKLIATLPAPQTVKQSLAWRWNERKRAAPAKIPMAADAFMVEVWASDERRHPFTLTLLNVDGHGGRLFQTRFEAGAVYTRLTVPVAEIAAQVDLDAPYLVQIEPIGEAEGVDVVFGLCDFVALQQPASTSVITSAIAAAPAPTAKPVKVVVWDLDETLWTGVLVENGVEGVRLRPEAVTAIRMLDERGVLQSVASKNNAPEALAALKAFGLDDYFLHPQIHWNPKSGSMAALAKSLNLGLDSVVFIDDQPFERAEVEAAHPMVRTLPHTDIAHLAAHPWFDLPVSAESRQRRALYRQEAHRTDAFETAGADYASFLRESKIALSIDPLTGADLERVFELSQRTNQLNFTGRKYAREDVQALCEPTSGETGLCLRCRDRFGDYGLIGFAVVDYAKGEVCDLFMSCRVQRKRVEQAFFAWLGAGMAGRGVAAMRVAHRPTGRNVAALEMLQSLEFTPSAEGAQTWSRPVSDPIADSDIVAIVSRAAAKAA